MIDVSELAQRCQLGPRRGDVPCLVRAPEAGVRSALPLLLEGSVSMRISLTHGLTVAVLLAATLLVAIPGHTQPASEPPAPTAPTSVPQPAPPDDLAWSELGATAQCADGTYTHDKPSQGTCLNHGGVRKWLDVRQQ
jgi:Protein of unknown function (DUF3761)